ncbi:MAG TPA: MBL fold metallo-hydrolase [Dehalococcoidia bacterium]|nr:MBL fold metallo-hydrolase [Dehalococcoidia bacterium]
MTHEPLELTFLGSGNAFVGARYWSSFVLNRRYLFDAPPTLLPHLNKLGIPTLNIAAVFVTHFHADHFFGLPFLFLDYQHLSKRTQDLVIIGPPGAAEIVEQVSQLGFSGLTRGRQPYRRIYIEAHDGHDGIASDLPFRSVAVEQESQSALDCFGYKVNVGGRILSYTGDTVMCDGVRELARDADVLVLDCSCWQGPCPHHMSFEELRRFRKEVPPKTTFVLTHLDVGAPPLQVEGMIVAEDFATIRL